MQFKIISVWLEKIYCSKYSTTAYQDTSSTSYVCSSDDILLFQRVNF